MQYKRLGSVLLAAFAASVLAGSAAASDLTLSPKTKLVIIHESSTSGKCAPGVSEPCDAYVVSIPFTTTKGNQVEPGTDLVFETNEIRFGPAGMCSDANAHPPVFITQVIGGALQFVAKKYVFTGVTTGFEGNGTPVFPFVSVLFTPKGSGSNLLSGTYAANGSADFSALTSGPVDIALVPVKESDSTPDNDLNCVEVTPVYQNEGF